MQLLYNPNNELEKPIKVHQQGLEVVTTTTHYHYDAFGRRIAKSSDIKESNKLGLKGNKPKFGLVSHDKAER